MICLNNYNMHCWIKLEKYFLLLKTLSLIDNTLQKHETSIWKICKNLNLKHYTLTKKCANL